MQSVGHWYDPYTGEDWQARLSRRFDHKHAFIFEDPEHAFIMSHEILVLEKRPAATITHHANTDAFGQTLFDWIVLDLARSINGRVRAPLALRQTGPRYVEVFMRHCIGRLEPAEIGRLVKLPVECVRACVSWIERHQKCLPDSASRSLSDVDGESLLDSYQLRVQGTVPEVEQQLEKQETHELIRALLASDDPPGDGDGDSESSVSSSGIRLPAITLSAEVRIILKMLYWEVLSLVDTARFLGKDTHTIRNARTRVLSRMRSGLRDYGIVLTCAFPHEQ